MLIVVLKESASSGKKSKDSRPAAPPEEEDVAEHKVLKQILQKKACSDHLGKVCYVSRDLGGKHYQLTNTDLSIWSTLAVCGFLLTYQVEN